MNRRWAWCLLLVTAAAPALTACGASKSTHEAAGGETHWLARCTEAVDCGSGLDCLCGRCTEICANDTVCQRWDEAASCLSASDVGFAADCAAPPGRLCALPAQDAAAPQPSTETDLTGADTDLTNPDITDTNTETDTDTMQSSSPGPMSDAGSTDVASDSEPASGANEPDAGSDGTPAGLEADAGPNADAGSTDACDDERARHPERMYIGLSAAECTLITFGCDPNLLSFGDECGCGCEPLSASPVSIDGAPYDEQRGCFGELTTAGTGLSTGCGEAETIAVAPDGACWWFSTTCIPEGFSPADEQTCVVAERCPDPVETLSCAERSLDTCGQDDACVIVRGMPYDEANACFGGESVPVACAANGLTCPPVITAALDADGDCISFGGCPPAGFTEATDAHSCSQFTQCPQQ